MKIKIKSKYNLLAFLLIFACSTLFQINVFTQSANCVVETVFSVNITPKPKAAFNFITNEMITTFSNTSTHATTYAWNFGDPDSGLSNSSSEINPTHVFSRPGTYTVSLTATNDCGIQNTTQTVVIECTKPQVNISSNSPLMFCSGNSVLLQAGPDNFVSYQWYLNNLPIDSETSSTYEATASGQYNVLITDSTGCQNFSNELLVEVYHLPMANINSSLGQVVCEGSSLELIASDGIDYQWVMPNGSTYIGENIYISLASIEDNGVYQLTVTDQNGCTAKADFNLIVNPLPIISIGGLSFNYTDRDSSVILIGTPTGGVFSGNGVVDSLFNPSVAGIGLHTIFYTFTDNNQCTNYDSVTVQVSPSVSTLNLKGFVREIKILPNPNQGKFWVNIDISSPKTLTFVILNNLGQTLSIRRESMPVGQSILHFDGDDWGKGVYFLKIMEEDFHIFLKVIITE